MEYDSLFVFEELGWNFEPSELGAAFGLVQLTKLRSQLRGPPTELRPLHGVLRTLPGPVRDAAPAGRACETAWLSYPFVIRPEGGLKRADFQRELEERGVDTRMVWTGNVTRQPMMRGVHLPRRSRRLPERRPGHGARADPAVQPLPHRRRRRLRVRRDRRGRSAEPVGPAVRAGADAVRGRGVGPARRRSRRRGGAASIQT